MVGTVPVAAHGLRVDLPRAWEARLYLRDAPTATEADIAAHALDSGGFRSRLRAHPAAYGHPGESTNPVLHLANFALPPGRGDFGTGAVELMGERHAFVALLEYDRAEAGTALFAARGLPRLRTRDFAPNALQRRIAGQLGCQRFFTINARAFCLYVVIGSQPHASALTAEVRDVLDAIQVGER